jgi:2-amino-4-hydroxy-6-hydroxymethyldihydropteridine diphosphokinase
VQRAASLLDTGEGIEVPRSSRVYETEPVGPPQPDFLNAVVEVSTVLTPLDLLSACLLIEEEMGRIRAERWGPRVIDVDVLTYGDQTIREPSLVVPHPRMHMRAFVLAPLLELDPDPPLPEGVTMATLRLPDQRVSLFAPALEVRHRRGREGSRLYLPADR